MLNPRQTSRFWEKVKRGSDTECWLWTAATDSSGYGRFSVGGRRLDAAHRISYRLTGQIIPPEAVIDHTCRTRLCVNPAHLRVVSRFTNVHENSEAVGHLNSLKTHCAKGHPFSGDNLYARPSGRRGCRACRAEYHRNRRASPSPSPAAGR